MVISQLFENPTVQYNMSGPAQIDPRLLQQLADLIAAGSEVDGSMVLRNLKAAQNIAYATDNGRAVGVIVLKNPVPAYRSKVFAAAGVPEMERNFTTELGYVYLMPEYRPQGVAARLLRLMNRSVQGNAFATTRENNTTINKILQFAGFKVTGEPYASARGDYQLFLWTK